MNTIVNIVYNIYSKQIILIYDNLQMLSFDNVSHDVKLSQNSHNYVLLKLLSWMPYNGNDNDNDTVNSLFDIKYQLKCISY